MQSVNLMEIAYINMITINESHYCNVVINYATAEVTGVCLRLGCDMMSSKFNNACHG